MTVVEHPIGWLARGLRLLPLSYIRFRRGDGDCRLRLRYGVLRLILRLRQRRLLRGTSLRCRVSLRQPARLLERVRKRNAGEAHERAKSGELAEAAPFRKNAEPS